MYVTGRGRGIVIGGWRPLSYFLTRRVIRCRHTSIRSPTIVGYIRIPKRTSCCHLIFFHYVDQRYRHNYWSNLVGGSIWLVITSFTGNYVDLCCKVCFLAVKSPTDTDDSVRCHCIESLWPKNPRTFTLHPFIISKVHISSRSLISRKSLKCKNKYFTLTQDTYETCRIVRLWVGFHYTPPLFLGLNLSL